MSHIGSTHKGYMMRPNNRWRMLSILRTMVIAISLVFILLAGVTAYDAPQVCSYGGRPARSDAIVLFLGSDDRMKEARRLLNAGYARFLIVPANQQVLVAARGSTGVRYASEYRASSPVKKYPRFYENTHVEVLYARKMMNTMGLRSAIMVSSPYHIERIRLIAGNVFGEQSRLFSYVPASYENQTTGQWEMNLADWEFEIMELIKICWFRLYSPFIGNRLGHVLPREGVLRYLTHFEQRWAGES